MAVGSAQNLRSLGIDVSTYQGNITAANWATLKRATNQQVGGVFGDGRDFVIIRATRGGTTGEDHRQGGYPSNNDTLYSQSERYDDPYYVQNINRATSAGLFAGSYHFARPDVVAGITNSDGTTNLIANTGTDEADHMIAMAGPWMRPGFLPPMLDLEAGQTQRTQNQMGQFCTDFSDRIYVVMGIRPGIYINGSYAVTLQSSASPSGPTIVSDLPHLWSARWPNQSNPNSIDVQNGNPKDSYTPIYGPWDDSPNPVHPWKVWQYASTAHVNAIGGGTANCDVDVAHGGIEYLKDLLVPAIWLTNADGLWSTLTNWNSGLTPVAPVPGPGQLTPIGTQTLPAPRLPGSNDTVILDRPSASVTITLDSGTHTIRKLYVRETLLITNGSLSLLYTPSWDSTNIAAQFSGPVTLSGNGSLSLHTLLVDTTRTFTLSGGSLTFDTINLTAGATPAKILINGDVNFASFSNNATATITNGMGSGTSGSVDLAGGSRTLSVSSGTELAVAVPVSNGGLFKAGPGTMRVTAGNTFAGGTMLSAGRLLVNNTTGSGLGPGPVTVNAGILGGTGTISGTVTVSPGGTLYPGPGSAMGTLTLGSAPILNGTNFFKIDRNGVSGSDKLSLSSGTLSYGGTLVVTNSGAALVGGESFTIFVAPTRTGSFAATNLPALDSGLNWYLGDLNTFGRIKANRAPTVTPPTFTNQPGAPLQIPISSLTASVSDADGDTVALAGINLTSTNGVALSTNGGFITYSNALNPADQIVYTITDGHGGITTAAVTIAPSTVGQFLGTVSITGSMATVRFAGGPGSTYYVDRSISLPVWTTISTNVMPPSGILDYVDDFHDLPAPPDFAVYRLRW